ncbi:AAA family ATPase [Bifidobacterium catulorum]|uniref:AAA+ ATPase domain-containing protein n=1 Tax=Bifidobacterium catulorum TaxID=1630173 RepID=A0A2U2MS73_9BIFI|nr:AAA family ATPase [Bifidobacterium catulorum]PWG59683.1 hypothetical protein DF200_06540 [Bifidobacterium catulorum]
MTRVQNVSDESLGWDCLSTAITGSQLANREFSPPEEFIPGIIPTGLVMLVGKSKIGKSWLALHLASAAASGSPVLGGIPVESRPVLYLAMEDSLRRLQSRQRRMGGPCSDLLYLMCDLPNNPEDPDRKISPLSVVESFIEKFDGRSPVVIIDTWGKVLPHYPPRRKEGAFERDYRLMGMIQDMSRRRPDATIIVLHHARKAAVDDFVDAVNGTTGLAAAADAIVVLDRNRKSTEGRLSITGRDIRGAEYSVRFDEDAGLWSLYGDSRSEAEKNARESHIREALSDTKYRVIDLVNQHPEGIGPKQVGETLGIDNKMASEYLRDGVRKELIRKISRGFYGPVE